VGAGFAAGGGGAGAGVSTFLGPQAAAESATSITAAGILLHIIDVGLLELEWSARSSSDRSRIYQVRLHMDRLLEATARAEQDHFWFRGFRRFVTPVLEQVARGRAPLRMLDCGCGTGNNLALLRRFGHACGLDITWSGLAYARHRGERQIVRASATCLPFPAAVFDLVASFDVLYAFDDEMERDALAEMFRVLRPGGHLLVNVAALKALTGNHSVLGGEVRRYHRDELRAHLESAGFEVPRITYTNFTLLPIVATVRFAQRLAGHRESDRELSVPSAPVNAALSGALAVEAAALKHLDMPLGSSLLALARKPTRTAS
jgi:SAM-dependent methyltransferase